MDKIVITTKGEYDTAMSRLAEIFDAEPNTIEGEELDALTDAIEAYEKIHYGTFIKS